MEREVKRLTLNKMPTHEMLEEFVNQMHGSERRQVHFNIERGEFEYKDERPVGNNPSEERRIPPSNG